MIAPVLVLQLALMASPVERPVIVASKPFGESYLLAEMFAQLLESHGIRVERRPGLGATEILFGASKTVRSYWYLLVVGAGGVGALVWTNLKNPTARRALD